MLLMTAVAVFGLLALSASGGDVENNVCADCHPDVAEMYSETAHGIYFSSRPALADYGCESCHGSGLKHIEEGTAESIINPANADQFGTSLLCLECHTTERFSEWEFSQHNAADVNCASCHSAHAAYAEPVNSEPDLCYGCHGEVLAATRMPSHHPISEGKVGCSDCHNPHGGSVALVRDNDQRELCFTCHPQMEGPFVFEHAPVAEDCMTCHTPHGSVANNLLKAQEPTLCLNCHPMHFHATVEGADGAFPSPQAPERAGFSTADGWKRGMLTRCTQCHQQVHGSDNPSQATSSGGTGLTR
jgi:DmsE family decaheme c-type cytochrome